MEELQTGQVAFLSGLLAGFSLVAAVTILRTGVADDTRSQVVICTLLGSTLLFLLALYVDVRLTIELANVVAPTPALEAEIAKTRAIGTSCASSALFLFIVSIGLLGWLANSTIGMVTAFMSLATLVVLTVIWFDMRGLQQMMTG